MCFNSFTYLAIKLATTSVQYPHQQNNNNCTCKQPITVQISPRTSPFFFTDTLHNVDCLHAVGYPITHKYFSDDYVALDIHCINFVNVASKSKFSGQFAVHPNRKVVWSASYRHAERGAWRELKSWGAFLRTPAVYVGIPNEDVLASGGH